MIDIKINLKKLYNKLLNINDNFVLQDWTKNLTFKQQTGLISTIRGNDAKNGTCYESKEITKMIRFLVLKDADKKTEFMTNKVLKQNRVIRFLKESYPTNQHWVEHIIGTAFNFKHNHPNNYVKEYWGGIGSIAQNNIKMFNAQEKERIKREAYIKKIINKYNDIYLNRFI